MRGEKLTIKLSPTEVIELSEQQRQWAESYLVCNNASEACRVAGYSKKNLTMQGNRMTSNESIQKYLRYRREQMSKETSLTKDKIVFQLINIGFTTIDSVMKWEGQDIVVKSLDEIPKEALPAIESISQHTVKGVKHIRIKMRDSLKAIDMLNRMFGWYADNEQPDGREAASKLLTKLREQYGKKEIGS
jgi:phage terminase small subunit